MGRSLGGYQEICIAADAITPPVGSRTRSLLNTARMLRGRFPFGDEERPTGATHGADWHPDAPVPERYHLTISGRRESALCLMREITRRYPELQLQLGRFSAAPPEGTVESALDRHELTLDGVALPDSTIRTEVWKCGAVTNSYKRGELPRQDPTKRGPPPAVLP